MRAGLKNATAAMLGVLAFVAAGAGALASVLPTFHAPYYPPDYSARIMQSVVLNPCQVGTPCGDAAYKKYGFTPYTIGPGHPPPGGGAAGSGRPVAAADTRYTPSPQISAAIKTQFIQHLDQALPPAQAQKMTDVIANHDLVGIWAREMAADGLHPNDMADAIASYWVLNWIMANHADSSPAQTVAVRNQIQLALAGGRISRLPDAGRQAVAEVAIIQFVTQSALYSNALKAHDSDTVAKLGEAAEQRFRNEMKIDLRSLALTDRGFARKG